MMKILVLAALSSILLTGVSATCRPDEFRCSTGQCIPRSKRCNRICDCRDTSDEWNCRSVTCRVGEWKCSSGQCIPLSSRCNGSYDCQDRSDEQSCLLTTCRPDQFRCNSGLCIPLTSRCNGQCDCQDRSDELNCPSTTCRPDQFRCNSGLCIPLTNRCNGQCNCQDKSDEWNCPSTTPISTTSRATATTSITVICREDQFTCTNGQCVNMGMRCDGSTNCQDGSDEQNCATTISTTPLATATPPIPEICPEDQFTCTNGQCVNMGMRCDGSTNCQDGSDEQNCGA